MKSRWVLSLWLMCASCGSSNDSCQADTTCAPGSPLKYHLCTGGADNCYYHTSDGHTFRCVTCGQCDAANAAVSAWCAAPPGSDFAVGNVDLGGTGGGDLATGFVPFDLAGTAPLDLAGSGCDVVAQSCAAGQKCVGAYENPQSSTVVGTCTADGTVGADQPCTQQPNPEVFFDNCLAGFKCDNNGPDAAYVCRKICTADAGCPAGQRCSALVDAPWGWCLPTCAPFGANTCANGNDCASSFDDISSTATAETGFFVCKKTGKSKVGTACNVDPDCDAGLWCDANSGQCQGICDGTHMCPVGGGTTPTCVVFSDQNGAGYCVAN